MNVEIRLYKRFDADLISLYEAGYSVTMMMKEAVIGFANGSPIHFYVDEITDFQMGVDSTFRSRFSIPDSDVKTVYMLKHLKPRCRNAFCKAVLRNSLVQQNLTCFFTDASLYQLQGENLKGMNLYSFKNLTPCSSLREQQSFEFAGQTIKVGRKKKKEKPIQQENNPFVTNTNPFSSGYNPGMANQMQASPVVQTPVNNYPQQYIQSPVMQAPVVQPVQPAPMQPMQTQYIPQPVQQMPQPVAQSIPQGNVQSTVQQPVEQTVSSNIEYTSEDIVESEDYKNNTSDAAIGFAGNDELLKMFDNL